ncbi:MAG: hypothetical protein FJZ59_05000 [Chlamydiae bacterium]|nr:hypothetical protein [Chlamydiota bacterium]
MDAFLRLIGWRSSPPPPAPLAPPTPSPSAQARTREELTSSLCTAILGGDAPTEIQVNGLIQNWNALKIDRISPALSDEIYKAACKINTVYENRVKKNVQGMLAQVFDAKLEEIERAIQPTNPDLKGLTNSLQTLWAAIKPSDLGKVGSPLSLRVEGAAFRIRECYSHKSTLLSSEIKTNLILLQRANFELVLAHLKDSGTTSISEEDHKTFTKVLTNYWASLGGETTFDRLKARVLFAAETLNSAKEDRSLKRIIQIAKHLPKDKILHKKSISLRDSHSATPLPAAPPASLLSPPHPIRIPSSSSLRTEVSPITTPSTHSSRSPSPVAGGAGRSLRAEPEPVAHSGPQSIRHTFDDLLTLANEVSLQINKSDLEGHAAVIESLFLNPEAYLIAAGEGISFDELCRNFVYAVLKLPRKDRSTFIVPTSLTWQLIVNYATRSVIEECYQARLNSLLMRRVPSPFIAIINKNYPRLLSQIQSGTGDIFKAQESAIRRINAAQERLFRAQEGVVATFLTGDRPIDRSNLTAIREAQKLLRGLLKNVINMRLRAALESRLTFLNEAETMLILPKAKFTPQAKEGVSQYDLVCKNLKKDFTKGAARHACAFIAAVNIEAQFAGTSLTPEVAIVRGLYRQQVALRAGLLSEVLTDHMTEASLTRLDDAKKLVRQSLTPIIYPANNIPFTDETGLDAYTNLLETIQSAMNEHEKVGAIIRLGEKYLSITMQRNESGALQITLADSHGFDRGSEASSLVERSFQCNFKTLPDAADFLSIYYRPKPPFNDANCIEFDLYTTKPPIAVADRGPGAAPTFLLDEPPPEGEISLDGEQRFLQEHKPYLPPLTLDVD